MGEQDVAALIVSPCIGIDLAARNKEREDNDTGGEPSSVNRDKAEIRRVREGTDYQDERKKRQQTFMETDSQAKERGDEKKKEGDRRLGKRQDKKI